MTFKLNEVVPWGRTFDEYAAMFALGSDDLERSILGCGDGPASFNATLTRRGGSVVSIDPLYRFTAEEIARRIDETYEIVMEQTRQNAGEFVWTRIRSLEELGEMRMGAMCDFLADYPNGKSTGRYIPGELPQLPFPDGAFELALCSHLLFLYSMHYDYIFHLHSLRELCRVAGEVRVFPLTELGSVRSRHVDKVASELSCEGYRVRLERVDYEFQKGGNEMLRLTPANNTTASDKRVSVWSFGQKLNDKKPFAPKLGWDKRLFNPVDTKNHEILTKTEPLAPHMMHTSGAPLSTVWPHTGQTK